MLIASGMGCVALQKGLGAIHALAHPLGALHDAHHGLLNAVLMPYVVEFNTPAIADKLGLLARVIDLPRKDPEGVLNWILDLRKDLSIPEKLSGMGLVDVDVGKVAEMSLLDPLRGRNPVKLDEPGVRRILAAALFHNSRLS